MALIEPTVFRFAANEQLPSVEEMVQLAQTSDWIIFQVDTRETVDHNGQRFDPTREVRDHIVRQLQTLLPDHRVTGSWIVYDDASWPAVRRAINGKGEAGTVLTGWGRFSTWRSITPDTINNLLDLFLTALSDYEVTINALVARLARQLGVDASTFLEDTSWHKHEQTGRLEAEPGSAGTGKITDEWNYFFHGFECAFGNQHSGVGIEARLDFGMVGEDTFAVLDPYFFLHFVNTTKAFAPVARALRNDFIDTTLALEHIERLGFLRAIHSERGGGWLLSDSGRQRVSALRELSETNHD